MTSPTGGRTAPLPIALSAARDRGFLPPAAASTSPSPATPTTEAAEERDVWASPVANSSSAGLKGKAPSTPVTNLMIVGGDEDDPEIEDEENENTPDMFHGAGIFLLAGGIAGAGMSSFSFIKVLVNAANLIEPSVKNSNSAFR